MSDLNSLEQEIRVRSEQYATDPENSRYLSDVTLGSVIGPFVVGKTTTIREACSIDADFCRVRSFTTREPRIGEGEDTYYFLPHDIETLRVLRDQISARRVVQFTVHPTTNRVYGSFSSDYTRQYALLDTMPSSLENLDTVPFRGKKRIALVTSPDEWLKRFELRTISTGTEDSRKRIKEGVASLEWALDQGKELFWVDNTDREVGEVALELIGIMREDKEQKPNKRLVGEKLLDVMRAIEL